MIRKILKQLMMKRRAQRLGENITDGFHPFFNPAYMPSLSAPKEQDRWRNRARTLIRLQHIIHGFRPFDTHIGWMGDVFISTPALESYGNLRKGTKGRPFKELGIYIDGAYGWKKPKPERV